MNQRGNHRVVELFGVVASAVLVGIAIHGALGHVFNLLDGWGLSPPVTGLLGPRALSPAAHEARRMFAELGVVLGALFVAWRVRTHTGPARFSALLGTTVLALGTIGVVQRLGQHAGTVPFGLASALLFLGPLTALACGLVLHAVERHGDTPQHAWLASGAAVLLVAGQLGALALTSPAPYAARQLVPAPAHVVTLARQPTFLEREQQLLRVLAYRYPTLSPSQRMQLAYRLMCSPCAPPCGTSIHRPCAPSRHVEASEHSHALGLAGLSLAAVLLGAAFVRHRMHTVRL